MSFLNTIKNDLMNDRNRTGYGHRCVVDAFEQADSVARSLCDTHTGLREQLHNVLHALCSEQRDSEQLMLLIMEILKPMIAGRVEEHQVDRRFLRHREGTCTIS